MRFCIAIVLLSGCLSIEAEIEESCISRRDVEIEGVTGTTISRAFLVDDLSDVHRLLEYDGDLELLRADIRATTDLGFVESASIAFEGTPVYACAGDCPADGNALTLPAATRESVLPYLSADSIAIALTVTGQLPGTAWSADIDVCVRGTVSYEVRP